MPSVSASQKPARTTDGAHRQAGPRVQGVRERLPPINVHIHPRYKPIMPARRPLQDSSNGTSTRDLPSQDLFFLVWEVLGVVVGSGDGCSGDGVGSGGRGEGSS